MSDGVEVWLSAASDIAEAMRDSGWEPRGEGWALQGDGWRVAMSGFVQLSGAEYRVDMQVQPPDAPAEAHEILLQTAQALALHLGGAVVPQRSRLALLQMSWWSVERPLLRADGVARFLETTQRFLPEAMPRDPDFAHALASGIFYPARPTLGFNLTYAADLQHPQLGFRCGRVDVNIEADALRRPGWPRKLWRFWREASHVLQPFYGEVRTRTGFARNGGTYVEDARTEPDQVRSWFWRGIPQRLGHAVVVGAPYDAAWLPRAMHERGLAFAETDDWTEVLAFSAPPALVAEGWTYAAEWPFARS